MFDLLYASVHSAQLIFALEVAFRYYFWWEDERRIVSPSKMAYALLGTALMGFHLLVVGVFQFARGLASRTFTPREEVVVDLTWAVILVLLLFPTWWVRYSIDYRRICFCIATRVTLALAAGAALTFT